MCMCVCVCLCGQRDVLPCIKCIVGANNRMCLMRYTNLTQLHGDSAFWLMSVSASDWCIGHTEFRSTDRQTCMRGRTLMGRGENKSEIGEVFGEIWQAIQINKKKWESQIWMKLCVCTNKEMECNGNEWIAAKPYVIEPSTQTTNTKWKPAVIDILTYCTIVYFCVHLWWCRWL